MTTYEADILASEDSSPADPVIVLGAGPAGLTAAWRLANAGVSVRVLEADRHKVGGISRTEEYHGYRFDIGGHRFYSKAPDVKRIWHEILPASEWLTVERVSRIYYRGKFFDYPLNAMDALRKLGLGTSVMCGLSYLRAHLFPRKEVRSFEDWIVNHFGWKLHSIFFKTYTEKVWGRPCTEISADWAAQRIKGLSLVSAVRNALPRRRSQRTKVIKTLIEEFEYPRLGPGQVWEHAASQVQEMGSTVELGSRAVEIHHHGGCVRHLVLETDTGREHVTGTDFISSIPLRELVMAMDPPAPPHVRAAAEALEYRDYLTVILVVEQDEVFADNWIYIHEPDVMLGRIQNYKNWSPHMVPAAGLTALGLEYFTNASEAHLWELSDAELIELGSRETAQIGLIDTDTVVDATVVRMPKAYPVYDEHYAHNVQVIRTWLQTAAGNLQPVGRNGMHKYNNQDHSMMSALLAAENILGADWDPWKVNTDAEYHEKPTESSAPVGRLVPASLAASISTF